MRILVTGSEGFIGKALMYHLKYELALGENVVGLDFPCDIANFNEYADLFNPKFDCVIHLAAFANLRDSIDDPETFWENNVENPNLFLIIAGTLKPDYYMPVLLVFMSGGGIHMPLLKK